MRFFSYRNKHRIKVILLWTSLVLGLLFIFCAGRFLYLQRHLVYTANGVVLDYEQELKKAQKDAQTRDRQQKEVRIRAARTKAEFDELKKQYDAEFKHDSEKLSALRAEAEKEAKKVDPALIARYRQIKQHVNPPIAKLVNNQCGGCFMSLPSAILKKLAAGDTTVECDNCGRILYLAEE